MQSFRTEIENPVVEKDIIELERKIREFQEGKVDEERFRTLRLARGVYGQRQQGVQMIRIKLPYGKMTARQFRRIADVCDTYSNGNLHTTTRQDIQIHYVSLEKTPELWAELERDQVTLREACGNTVRNVTASALAGIDPEEPFDVTPYAHAFFSYFLRNPICQEMGRKFKVCFSSSDADSAFSFIHDLGFIPKIKEVDGKQKRGFKVMIGGGLGAQPIHAQVAFDFLPAEEVIPLAESILRIFDRHGERSKRFKARFKYLLKNFGLEKLFQMIDEEKKSLPYEKFPVIETKEAILKLGKAHVPQHIAIPDRQKYLAWLETNVTAQKQPGFYAISIKLPLGDLSTEKARKLADLVEGYAGDDIRVTVNQGFLLRFVKEEALPYLFLKLDELRLAEPGFDSLADITACPGTDTCNLGISSSTGIAKVLEEVIRLEYPDYIYNTNLKIKISGCMNACGQHTVAGIGFHGSTLKAGELIVPALQVLLGGGTVGNGQGVFAEKVIKVPSKRGPLVLRYVLDDFEENAHEGEYFYQYYQRQGKKYFYALLKPLADQASLTQDDFKDWGHESTFEPAIGVGECAGVIIDLVATLLVETEEKLIKSRQAFEAEQYADAIYHSYSGFINGAKAILVSEEIPTNTQSGIVRDFDKHFVVTKKFKLESDFASQVYRMKHEAPTREFASLYLKQAQAFFQQLILHRKNTFIHETTI